MAGSSHNWETERAVLGACILGPQMVPVVGGVLGPDDWSRPQHAALWSLMVELAAKGDGGLVSILDAIERQGDRAFDVYGGPAYVVALPQACQSVDHAEHHAKAVRDHAIRRRADLLAAKVREAIAEGKPTIEVVDMLDAGAREIGSVARTDRPPGTAVEMADEAIAECERMAADPREITGLATGMDGPDRWFRGLQRGHMYVLGARPKMGKTAWLDQLLCHVADRQPVTVGLASMEMSREEIGRRRLSQLSGVPLNRIATGRVDRDDIRRLEDARARSERLSVRTDDGKGLSLASLRMRWRAVQREEGLALLAVDYLQLLEPANPRWDSRRVVGYNAQGLAALADELACAVVVLSQVTRAVEGRPDKRPGPSDLMESGAIEAAADSILTLYRDEVYQPDSPDKGIAELLCCVNRNGETGRRRMVARLDVQTFTDEARGW